jgi:hypothetical protein
MQVAQKVRKAKSDDILRDIQMAIVTYELLYSQKLISFIDHLSPAKNPTVAVTAPNHKYLVNKHLFSPIDLLNPIDLALSLVVY